MRKLQLLLSGAMVLLASGGKAQAGVMYSNGAGTAVSVADRTATFDSLASSNISLTNYSEDNLRITVPDSSFVGFDPFNDGSSTMFHYGSGGNNSFVTIVGTDAAIFSGIEFKLGNGNAGTTTGFLWETRLNGSVNGAGYEAGVVKGSVVGFSGMPFSELRVAAFSGFNSNSSFGDSQAIALDGVNAQLQRTSAVPEPASLGIFAAIGLASCCMRRRRRALLNT